MKIHNEQQLEFAKWFYQIQGLSLVTESNSVLEPQGAVKNEKGKIIGYHESCEFFWIGASVEVGITYRKTTADLICHSIKFKAEILGAN